MTIRFIILIIYALNFARAQNGYPRDNPSLGYNPFGRFINSDETINGDEIPGEAGRDYPVYSTAPDTGFSCNNQQYPGYYADPGAGCQAFYICQKSGKGVPFLCPNGTIFNQEYLVCDWWYNFDCGRARQYYRVNEAVYRAMEDSSERLRLSQEGYNYYRPQGYQSNDQYRYQTRRPSTNYGSPLIDNGINTAFNAPRIAETPFTSQNYNSFNRILPDYGSPRVSPNRNVPRLTYGVPNNDYNYENINRNNLRNGNGYRRTNGIPSRTYLPSNNIDRSYLPPSNNDYFVRPAPQYGPPEFSDVRNDLNTYNGNGQTPERSYLPPPN